MPYLGILACKFGKVLSYFQQPRILQNEKFRAKSLTVGPRMSDIAAILKKYFCHIRNQKSNLSFRYF